MGNRERITKTLKSKTLTKIQNHVFLKRRKK
jgi:hypothetical protein